jgi:Ti-type conjugative transfer relaxase TraA
MAIYHLSVSNISRSQGRSVVAAAAYRSGECLTDARYEKVQDYSRKTDIAHAELMLPAQAPSWMAKREQLWNAVEAFEKRKDARLAREVQFSLPRELNLEQNIALAKEFVQKTFVEAGMVADLSVHTHVGKDGEEQPHVHVLLLTREVNADGFGMKNPEWNRTELLCQWREAWAEFANHHLALHGHDIQIDHRSYEAQGIELEPQHKIGAVAVHDRLARLADHHRIARENGERITKDPALALKALTHQQSTFTLQDLAKFVSRHTEDAEQFVDVYTKVQACKEMVYLGLDQKGQERYTTEEMLKLEQQMLMQARSLHQQERHAVSAKALTSAIAQRSLSEEQRAGLQHITAQGDLKCLVGYAGTGKSYLLGAAREAWEASGYRVRGVALSGIAAQNLEQSSGIVSRTVASQVWQWGQGREQLSERDILVIDEAGMLGSRQMARLVAEAQQRGAKVVLIGDPQQLQAIEAGAAFRAIAEQHGYKELTEIRRQHFGWQKEATYQLAHGRVAEALYQYAVRDHIHTSATSQTAKQQLMAQWQDVRHTHSDQTQIILAYTRKDVRELNEMARAYKQQDGELGIRRVFQMDQGTREFAIGDRVYFLKRDHGLKVVNGTLGTIRGLEGHMLKVELDRDDLQPRDRLVEVDTRLYKHLEHGYAATVYKAQGVTVDRTYLLASRHYDAHSSYVGLSRHRLSCDVFVNREEFADNRQLAQVLGCDRAKDVSLDYWRHSEAYGRQRGVEPDSYAYAQMVQREQAFSLNSLERTSDAEFISPAKSFEKSKGLMGSVPSPERQPTERELRTFDKQFGQQNPELGAKYEDTLQPMRSQHSLEEQALAVEKRLKEYGERIVAQKLPMLPQEEHHKMQEWAYGIHQDQELMRELASRPSVVQQIDQMSKQHEVRQAGLEYRGFWGPPLEKLVEQARALKQREAASPKREAPSVEVPKYGFSPADVEKMLDEYRDGVLKGTMLMKERAVLQERAYHLSCDKELMRELSSQPRLVERLQIMVKDYERERTRELQRERSRGREIEF